MLLCLGETDVAASVQQSNVDDAIDAAAVAAAADDNVAGELLVTSDIMPRDINSGAVEFDVMSDSVHQQPLFDTTNSIVIIGELRAYYSCNSTAIRLRFDFDSASI